MSHLYVGEKNIQANKRVTGNQIVRYLDKVKRYYPGLSDILQNKEE